MYTFKVLIYIYNFYIMPESFRNFPEKEEIVKEPEGSYSEKEEIDKKLEDPDEKVDLIDEIVKLSGAIMNPESPDLEEIQKESFLDLDIEKLKLLETSDLRRIRRILKGVWQNPLSMALPTSSGEIYSIKEPRFSLEEEITKKFSYEKVIKNLINSGVLENIIKEKN